MDQYIDAVETSFDEAKAVPVHPTNPELEAVEVMELLPNDLFWKYE